MAGLDVAVEGGKRFRGIAEVVRAAIVTSLRSLGVTHRAVRVCLVGDGIMKNNVLSFSHPPGVPRPDYAVRFLGEIYLNPSYIRKQGGDVRAMAVHGLLHLLGYDHARKRDIMEMERIEKRLRTVCNSLSLA